MSTGFCGNPGGGLETAVQLMTSAFPGPTAAETTGPSGMACENWAVSAIWAPPT